jgi:serine/threonine protein kinase
VLSKFAQEVRVLARLRHPNLILFMGYTLRPEPCIVSEYMPRGSLFSIMRQRAAASTAAAAVSNGAAGGDVGSGGGCDGGPEGCGDAPGLLDTRLQRVVAVSVARGMAYLHTRNPPILHLDLK